MNILTERIKLNVRLLGYFVLFLGVILLIVVYGEILKENRLLDIKVNEVQLKEIKNSILMEQLMATPSPTLPVKAKK